MEMDNVYQVKRAGYAKMVGIEPRKNNTPTEKDLELIKKFYKDANKDNVVVYTMSFCNTIADRQEDTFPEESIKTMVKTVVGKHIVDSHDTHKDSIGKIYNSFEKKVDYECNDGTQIKDISTGFIDFYIPKEKKYEEIIKDIDSGMKEYSSPGFSINNVTCSICGKDYMGGKCDHIAGKKYDGKVCHTVLGVKECVEVSLVYLGAQYYSQIVKDFKEGGNDMELKEQFDKMKKEFEDYKKKYNQKDFEDYKKEYNKEKMDALTKEKNSLEEMIKVFGEKVTKVDLEQAKVNSEIGKEARENSIKEIKRMKALIDTAKGLPVMEKSLDKFLQLADYGELKEFEKSLIEEVKIIPTGKQTETEEFGNLKNEKVKNYWN